MSCTRFKIENSFLCTENLENRIDKKDVYKRQIMMKSVNKYIQYSLHYYCIFIFHFIFLFCFTELENAEKSMIFIYIVYCLSGV